MKGSELVRWLSGWVGVVLSSCTSSSHPWMGETRCDRAIAEVSRTWQVNYYRDRTRIHPQGDRLVDFNQSTLIMVNGEKPETATAELHKNGLWYPVPPAPPRARDIEAAREFGERIAGPELVTKVDYSLVCAVGTLETSSTVYQQAFEKIRQQGSVLVSYAWGNALRVGDSSK